MEPRAMWVRITGCTVYVFPPRQTRSQLTDRAHQAGAFRGDGVGHTSAVAYTPGAAEVHLGWFDTRLEAIAAILRHHNIAPTDQSIGIR